MRVLVFQEQDGWIAMGIEHDICSQGETMQDAFDRFTLTLELEKIERGGFLIDIPRAPVTYEERWNKATKTLKMRPDLDVRMEGAQ